MNGIMLRGSARRISQRTALRGLVRLRSLSQGDAGRHYRPHALPQVAPRVDDEQIPGSLCAACRSALRPVDRWVRHLERTGTSR